MNNNVETVKNIMKDVKALAPKATDAEIVSIAVQIQRNQILRAGLNVSYDDSNLPSLEAVAVALGYSPQFGFTIPSAISDARAILEEIREAIAALNPAPMPSENAELE